MLTTIPSREHLYKTPFTIRYNLGIQADICGFTTTMNRLLLQYSFLYWEREREWKYYTCTQPVLCVYFPHPFTGTYCFTLNYPVLQTHTRFPITPSPPYCHPLLPRSRDSTEAQSSVCLLRLRLSNSSFRLFCTGEREYFVKLQLKI